MTIKTKKQFTIVVHPGSFHADDVCAVATLLLYIEKKYGADVAKKTKIIRTSDMKIIDSADFVVDVGLVYNPKKKRFDHHQKGRAGSRENGVLYASFGLVWKEYGKYLCGSSEAADVVDRILVQDVDTADNGIDFFTSNYKGTYPFRISDMVMFEKTSNKGGNDPKELYKSFIYIVGVMKRNIQNVIREQKRMIDDVKIAKKIYSRTKDKSFIILSKDIILVQKQVPETKVVIYKSDRGTWALRVVRENYTSFKSNFEFPKKWAGQPVEKLVEMTGVEDVVFAHPGRFYMATLSKAGAIKLAQIAIKEVEGGSKLAKAK